MHFLLLIVYFVKLILNCKLVIAGLEHRSRNLVPLWKLHNFSYRTLAIFYSMMEHVKEVRFLRVYDMIFNFLSSVHIFDYRNYNSVQHILNMVYAIKICCGSMG